MLEPGIGRYIAVLEEHTGVRVNPPTALVQRGQIGLIQDTSNDINSDSALLDVSFMGRNGLTFAEMVLSPKEVVVLSIKDNEPFLIDYYDKD